VAWVCQAFDGVVSWVAAEDQTDPVFGIQCREVHVDAGNLSVTKLGSLFRLLRDLIEHPFP
jgi:hypothetical protein